VLAASQIIFNFSKALLGHLVGFRGIEKLSELVFVYVCKCVRVCVSMSCL